LKFIIIIFETIFLL